jgi:APA family basic amino acid/polyamine antiporter
MTTNSPEPESARDATLRRVIRLPHATSLVVGTIIGASIFVQPSEITGRVPSLAGVSLVWLVAGVLTLFGALVTAELASAMPRSGGVYVFLRETISPLAGFLWGWAMFFTMHSGIIAAIAVIFARYLGYFVPLGPLATRLAAVAAIVVVSAVNYLGARPGSRLQTGLTVIKVAAIVLIVAVGFALGPREALAAPEAVTLLGGGSWGDFAAALVAALFAFGGWHMVTYNAEETVEPERTIPRALLLGTLTVTAAYVALNAVYFHVLPLAKVVASDRVAADAADAVLGSGGGAFLSALVVTSTLGALAGIVLAGPRVYFAMARDGLVFRRMAATHPVFRTPHVAIVLQGVWASVLVLTGSYRVLFTRVVYTEWLFFGLMAVGLFVLRRRTAPSGGIGGEHTGVERRYSVWGYPVVPAVFAAAAFAITVNQVVAEPWESATGLGLVLSGVPVYWIVTRRARMAA